MTDRPIIFSAPMVRALLAGRKTQTRRVIKADVPLMPALNNVRHQPPKHEKPYLDAYCSEKKTPTNPRGMSDHWCWWTRDDRCGLPFKVGFVPGDRLWVREAYVGGTPGVANLIFRAEHEEAKASGPRVDVRWRPSIHMPRWASRLTLTVTDVRVQRLQDISREDVIVEGVEGLADVWAGWHQPYAALWDNLHGVDAWDANPWVAALTFTVAHENIDASSTRAA